MSNFGDKIVSFFNAATVKLEELQVQGTLGKAELADKLEEIKSEAKEKIQDIRNELNLLKTDQQEHYNTLKGKVEHLGLQAALAKAETAEELEEQKKNLSAALHDVKNIILEK